MIELKLTHSHFEELLKKGYSLDIIFLLKLCETNHIYEYTSNMKVDSLYKTCIRKGLLKENDELTLEGKELLNFLSSTKENIKIKKKNKEDSFEKWWKVYPGTDTFEYKDIKFIGTRALKAKKDDCKSKLNAILNEGDYTIEDVVGALEIEILQKKENSYKTKQNKMSYFQNSLTYLNQRTFEPFIELFKAGHKVKESVVINGTDI